MNFEQIKEVLGIGSKYATILKQINNKMEEYINVSKKKLIKGGFLNTIVLSVSQPVHVENDEKKRDSLREEFCSYYTMLQLVKNIYTFAQENIKKDFAFSHFSVNKCSQEQFLEASSNKNSPGIQNILNQKKYKLLNPFFNSECSRKPEYPSLFSSPLYGSCLNNQIPLFFVLEEHLPPEKDSEKNITNLTIVIRGTHTVRDVLGDLNCIAIKLKDLFTDELDLSLTEQQKNEFLGTSFSECLIHKQFLINSLRIYLIIYSFLSKRKEEIEIKDLSKYHTINICGHSMGGSVATILSLLMYTVLVKRTEKQPNINAYAFNPGVSFVDSGSIETLRKDIKSNKEKLNYSIKNYIFRSDPISRASPIKLLFNLSLEFLMKMSKKIIYIQNVPSEILRGSVKLTDYKKFINEFQSSISSDIKKWENDHNINLEYSLFYIDDEDIINFLDSENTRHIVGKKYFESIPCLLREVIDHRLDSFLKENKKTGGLRIFKNRYNKRKKKRFVSLKNKKKYSKKKYNDVRTLKKSKKN